MDAAGRYDMPGSEIKDSLSLISGEVARGLAFMDQFFQAPVPTRQCEEGQTETRTGVTTEVEA